MMRSALLKTQNLKLSFNIFSLIFSVLIITSLLCTPLQAALADENTRVFDNAHLFTEDECHELENSITEIRQKYPLDLVIVTTTDTKGKSSQTYADDFYDEGNFGYQGSYDGILFLINMQDRKLTISTDGSIKKYFTDSRIDKMLDDIVPFLSNQDYYKGSQYFLEQVVHYINVGVPSKHNILLSILVALVLSAIIALITRAAIIYSYKHPHFSVPSTLPDPSSVHYTEKSDHFRSSYTTRVKVQPDDSDETSSRTSSDEHSHDGDSRDF